MRRALVALVIAIVLAPLGGTVAAGTAAASTNDTIAALTISGSPFAENLAPLPTSIAAQLVLARTGRVTLRVFDSGGGLVRTLALKSPLGKGAHGWTWDGRDNGGALAPDGLYVVRARVANGRGTAVVERSVRKGLPAIYSANPGAIVICVDPGHGGRLPGAASQGFAEKNFNLDIALKLRTLLQHAGVQVVMTRTSDVAVLEPASDFNGDGKVNRYDDDLKRNDVKNLARADVAVHVHNNGNRDATASGTGTFIPEHRTWTPLARDLATGMLAEEFSAVSAYASTQFTPVNNGVQYGRFYYYMYPYDPPFLARPSLVTSVLSESIFVSNASDLEMLKRDDVRTSLAASIYLGLARWLNTRDLGIGYELVNGPALPVAAGSPLPYTVRVTNRGNLASSGWKLQLHNVPWTPLYDGSGELGTLMGEAVVPDGLAPGQSVDVIVNATAPASAAGWWVKADVRLTDGSQAADAGVAPLQVALTTTGP